MNINDLWWKEEEAFKVLVDMSVKNEAAFKYILNSDSLFKSFVSCVDFRFPIDNLTVPVLKLIEKESTASGVVMDFVRNSDDIYKDSQKIKELQNTLSKNKIETPIKVYRGDFNAGMFDSVKLTDEKLIKEIRQLNEEYKEFAEFIKINGYSTKYMEGHFGYIQLYDYIKNKEVLTLADAMQMMPFFIEKGLVDSQNKIINLIKNTKIVDTRFKSTSLSDKFVNHWLASHNEFQTSLTQRITLAPNTEAVYVKGGNGQYEFIVNNKPKELSFENVHYNSDKNIFVLDTNLRML